MQVDEKSVSHVTAVIMLRRSDKQPDRVEISPEQQSYASIKAEVCKNAKDSPDNSKLTVHSEFPNGGGVEILPKILSQKLIPSSKSLSIFSTA